MIIALGLMLSASISQELRLRTILGTKRDKWSKLDIIETNRDQVHQLRKKEEEKEVDKKTWGSASAQKLEST